MEIKLKKKKKKENILNTCTGPGKKKLVVKEMLKLCVGAYA